MVKIITVVYCSGEYVKCEGTCNLVSKTDECQTNILSEKFTCIFSFKRLDLESPSTMPYFFQQEYVTRMHRSTK